MSQKKSKKIRNLESAEDKLKKYSISRNFMKICDDIYYQREINSKR